MEARRGILARIGVTLLNLLAPGLGLLRIGQLRSALLTYALALSPFVVLLATFATTEDISFGLYATVVTVVLLLSLAAYLLAFWWTWRRSGVLVEPRPFWAGWYSVGAAALAAFAISWVLTGVSQRFYHNFYAPSEGMEPSLIKGDRFLASMRPGTQFRRGDILLVKTAEGATYVKRVAALPGDRINLKDGEVFINGVAASRISEGARRVSYPYLPQATAQIFREKFPGEVGSHLIQDLGSTAEDNFPETVVAAGHLFLLGDNRDDSADSRVPEAMGGLEQVPFDRVAGRPLFTYWPLAKIGHSLRGPEGLAQ